MTITPKRDSAAGIVHLLRKAGHEAWFVGGCVRDFLRGVEAADYDIVTSASPVTMQELFPHTVSVGIRFGIIIVIEQGNSHEVATYRSPGGYLEDILQRDFTINAMLQDPDTGRIIDEAGGREDLERRKIRAVGSPEERFAEDRLRMLRAVRFAANLGFSIDPETFSSIKTHASGIHEVSPERITDELNRLLTLGGAGQGMRLLEETALLKEILPEVAAMKGVKQPPKFHPEGDVWTHTLLMLDRMTYPVDPRLAWGVLLHDVGKPDMQSRDERGIHFYGHDRRGAELAENILRRLRFSRADMETLLGLIRCHMIFINIREMRPNRLKRLLRIPNFDLYLELHRLDSLGSHGGMEDYDYCRMKQSELTVETLKPPPLIDGNDLQEMGFSPGPLFKRILTEVEDAQLNGWIATPEDARRLVKTRWPHAINTKEK